MKTDSQQSGFTLIEVLVAMAAMSVIAVVTTGMLFTSLTWGDRVRAGEEVEESVKVLDRTVRLAVESADDVTGGGSSLLVTGADECWSFVWDSLGERLNYSHISSSGCTPEANPTGQLLGGGVVVSGLDFDIVDLALGGRQVRMEGVISRNYPLGDYERQVGLTVINYMIGEQ